MQAPLFQRSSRFGYRRWLRSGWLLVRLAPDTPHKARDGCDPACRRNSTSRDSRKVCCAGGRSFGTARHWHPVLKIYMIPFITSRTSTWRLLPPRLAGGINTSTSAHSSSVRSLGYRNLLRSYRARFFAVHIWCPPNQATTLESQTIHVIQDDFGQTLISRCAA